MDIDFGVPTRDLVGFIVHMGELINRSSTDHFDVVDELTGQDDAAPARRCRSARSIGCRNKRRWTSMPPRCRRRGVQAR
jgi:hypothetical protein